MSIAVLRSRALTGMEAPAVSVEVHLANRLPGLMIVGLPDAEVREAKDRVRAALQNVGFEMPSRRIKGSQAHSLHYEQGNKRHPQRDLLLLSKAEITS